MAPILRGAPLWSENERAIFAFFTLVSYIGPHAPYRQTERGNSYKLYLEKLLTDNKAYWRFCSAETLEEERKKAESEEKTPRYAGTCRAKTSAEAARRVSQGEKGIIRFNPPKTLM
jgi:glutamyl/glutaminyl-tRNA synthetase